MRHWFKNFLVAFTLTFLALFGKFLTAPGLTLADVYLASDFEGERSPSETETFEEETALRRSRERAPRRIDRIASYASLPKIVLAIDFFSQRMSARWRAARRGALVSCRCASVPLRC